MPFTAPVHVLHAMEQALAELADEGVDRRIARYAENARMLRDGLTRLGFAMLVPEAACSNVLTTFRLPDGVPYDPLHDALKRRGYVIEAGEGDLCTHAFRVANIGALTPADMRDAVAAFAASLEELGVAVAAGG
jgi:2-aminoethylphosphonate-pyruvate transaminase